MPILNSEYNPKGILKWRHANTMYPYLFRKSVALPFHRERFETKDGDFLDIDWLQNGHEHLVILCHGLEGSSSSQYILHTAKLLSQQKLDVLALNYRSCSGEMNRTPQMYHSGFTHDLHEIISQRTELYTKISLVGYSLGGNMILKYMGDGVYPLSAKLHSAVAMSVPCDLSGSAGAIARWYNKAYEIRFLRTLRDKMQQKHEQFPDIVRKEDLKKVHSVWTFDEYFTGPLHGFAGAEDYYQQCNSLQFLENITVPTLLINARDDSFLSEGCYPYEIAQSHEYLHLKTPDFGGHVGFTTFGAENYWNEQQVLTFVTR